MSQVHPGTQFLGLKNWRNMLENHKFHEITLWYSNRHDRKLPHAIVWCSSQLAICDRRVIIISPYKVGPRLCLLLSFTPSTIVTVLLRYIPHKPKQSTSYKPTWLSQISINQLDMQLNPIQSVFFLVNSHEITIFPYGLSLIRFACPSRDALLANARPPPPVLGAVTGSGWRR